MNLRIVVDDYAVSGPLFFYLEVVVKKILSEGLEKKGKQHVRFTKGKMKKNKSLR